MTAAARQGTTVPISSGEADDLRERLRDVEARGGSTHAQIMSHEHVCAERYTAINARFATFEKKMNWLLALVGAVMLGVLVGPQEIIPAIIKLMSHVP